MKKIEYWDDILIFGDQNYLEPNFEDLCGFYS